MRLKQLLLFLCAICCTPGHGSSSSVRHPYTFTYPLSMTSNEPAKVCLEIEKDLVPAIVKVGFGNGTCDGKWQCGSHIVKSEFSCWYIRAPIVNTMPFGDPTTISLEIRTSNRKIQFFGKDLVMIQPTRTQVFIETDRRVYKMGDTVKVRLLALHYDLKPPKDYKVFLKVNSHALIPTLGAKQIPTLSLHSPYPNSKIVKVWENITTYLGLAHLDIQLAPEIPEGDWSITGDGIYTSFTVEKYILPRFEVLLSGPDVVQSREESVTYKVCGKYSYGRSLKGVALLKVDTYYGNVQPPLSKLKNLTDGCAEFKILWKELKAFGNFVRLTASVTEDGTEQVESTEMFVSLNEAPYSFEWKSCGRFYKPERPCQITLSLTEINIPLYRPRVKICYGFIYEEPLACGTFKMDPDNTIKFFIPPLQNVTKNLQVEANLVDYQTTYTPTLFLTTWFTKNKDVVDIIASPQNQMECGANLRFTVYYTSENLKKGSDVEFNYMLVYRGEIITAGSMIDRPRKLAINMKDYSNVINIEGCEPPIVISDKFVFEIKLDKKVYGTSQLLVYYENDGEIISGIIDVEIHSCSPNKVKAQWKEPSLYPGETGHLDIRADPYSLCSISSIDKASTFLGTKASITIDLIFSYLWPYVYLDRINCYTPDKSEATALGLADIGRFPPLRHYTGYDTFEAFTSSGVGVISNLRIINKPCENFPRRVFEKELFFNAAVERGDANGAPVDNRGSQVRSFFPETWLWDLVPIAASGEITVERKLPDSITIWEGNVICSSNSNGVGISETIEIQGFKPFFVDILLPYSIKRNKEILHLLVPVYNYLNNSLPIRVTLEPNSDIVLVDGDDKKTFTICLAPQDSYTHTYRIKATKLGEVSITVSAEVDPAAVPHCASDSVTRRKDVIRRPLLVEPEGYPSLLVKSTLLCTDEKMGVDKVDWKIELPKNVVPDTVDGKITINSDILGPVFQNLENLLTIPIGCGEQTMITLTPNLYVLKYLEANNALTSQVKDKILNNLEIGYQRMLNYVHNDGSFSAFGQSDPGGSTFLTALVIRTFEQMKKYIFIDETIITQAQAWIISHQLANGCFDPVYHVLHNMGIASSPDQTTALTSYVVISFLETSLSVSSDVLSKAKQCILNDASPDKYALAISSYALNLMGATVEGGQRLDELMQVASTEDGMIWWIESDSVSANVETTSYALISLLQQDPVNNLGTAHSIVRWLQTNMNPSGGFYSTADTNVGLDALSRYATLIYNQEPNVVVSIVTKTDSKDFVITKRDSSVTEIMPLTTFPNRIRAKIKGQGCVALQAIVKYYIDSPPVVKDLKLGVTLSPIKNKCSLISLVPCASYASSNTINMAIVDVPMPSGYSPDQASLYELTTAKVVKKFELIQNRVVLYLTELGQKEVCMPFRIEETSVVENVDKSTVTLYDYYNPQLSASNSYNIEECKSKIIT